METEVAIVGAGPAGLSAAVAASEAGCRVTIVDAYARPGGQYYKQMPGEFHPRRPETLYHDFSQAQQLFAKLDDHARVQVLSGTTVWTVQAASTPGDPVTLYLNTGAGSVGLRAEKVILAPGAYDRVLPFPGWDLPGVMTMGAAQTLVKSQRVLPGQRVVLSGSGPFLLPVAAGLAQAGAQVVAVYEATTPLQWVRHAPRVWNHWDKLREGGDYVQLLRKQGVPLQFGRAVIRASGDERVQHITVARLSADWQPIAGSEEQREVDAVCIGYGFVPSLELSSLLGCTHRYDPVQATFVVQHDADMQSSRAGVFVAGEITGIGGSAVAMPQGTLAGLAVARQLGRLSESAAQRKMAPYRKALRHRQAFAVLLQYLFRLRPGWLSWMTPETLVCRCEEVPFQQIEAAIKDDHARDVKTVKALTRCGMGLCQGRVCGPSVAAITAALTGQDPAQLGALMGRPIVKPITLGALCDTSH
ncbi:MAG: FAD/NAD(P)-binding oxidoreductase [Acidobacteria bacterium]|nr:MAG: FAD/NAD(P)-binding oxidoreductase [Acidobacteriota bacterium]